MIEMVTCDIPLVLIVGVNHPALLVNVGLKRIGAYQVQSGKGALAD